MRRIACNRFWVFAATAAAACAAETTAPPPEPAPREDSIAAARRDFDLIKSSRESGTQPSGSLPKFSVPELQSAPPPAAWSPSKPGAPQQKSAHWLLEAMEKKPGPRPARAKADDSPDRRGSEAEVTLKAGTERADRKVESLEGTAPRREEPVINPLARYMAGWMKAEDLALMKPVMDARAGGEFSGTTRTGAAVSVSEFVLPGNGDDLTGPNSSLPSLSRPPLENPYLQALRSPGPVPGSFSTAGPAALAGIPAAPATAPAPLPPPPPPKSNIPNFAKPATDEKYFKQLKRF